MRAASMGFEGPVPGGCLCRRPCGGGVGGEVPGNWAVAGGRQSGCRMQDGVRCVISEREARRCWCSPGYGRHRQALAVCRQTGGGWSGLQVRSRSPRPPTRGMESWPHRRLQGAGDGDQLMEGEELWGPGKGGPSSGPAIDVRNFCDRISRAGLLLAGCWLAGQEPLEAACFLTGCPVSAVRLYLGETDWPVTSLVFQVERQVLLAA